MRIKYLIDTHILLWTLFDSNKINPKIRKELLSNKTEKYISGLSFWEISLKYSLGKLEIKNSNPNEIYNATIQSGFKISEITAEIMSEYHKLPIFPEHRNPFDRMLAWHAISEGCTFMTQDKQFLKYNKFGLTIIN